MTGVKAADPGLVREVPLRGMRGAIAQAMTFSLQQMAQLTLHREIRFPVTSEGEVDLGGLGVNAAVLLATARALAAHPEVNATVEDGVIRQWSRIDIGVAVAVEDGLTVPVLRNADSLTGVEIAAAVKDLATRARAGRLTFADLERATFSVTNLGGHGIDFFTPIVNPPQAAILGVGRLRGAVMSLSLTIDHRALDGAPGAQFLATIEEELERLRGGAS